MQLKELKKEFEELWDKEDFFPNTKRFRVVWQFIEKAYKEGKHEGYKKGVEDEIKCVETSGEHLDLQKKLKSKQP